MLKKIGIVTLAIGISVSSFTLSGKSVHAADSEASTFTSTSSHILNTLSDTNNLISPRAGIKGQITINNINYNWIETSWGKNRGITFNPGNHVYQLSPNPHNDPWYNKNQVKFYNAAVAEIAKQGNKDKWSSSKWPNSIKNIVVNKIPYTLTER
ncbi:hypothetical protein FC683_27065 [Bacillus cereus]|uniref:hypothetical protein n=1 Tax=Bacillus cereus TaxID=1396 RepID=UPI0010BD2100|nr:hypothetical protein [Bacillus cereus]TKI22218.1 hypothetical protein FC683_27065 [Bacillus cereus]